VLALILSLVAFGWVLGRDRGGGELHAVQNIPWLQMGSQSLDLGWVLDPLTAVMLVMVSFVGLLIFIYSIGYMAHDPNYTRFFGFLALFAAAMLGVVIANSLLFLFICWELVGLASYLLIGFWFEKPSAAAAAKKAFITTRIGDMGLFLGMLWLYSSSGTLLFYDHGQGCLEVGALAKLAGQTTLVGMAVSTGVSLLIFCGAIGKSGQVPLHVWLPDAMEGPTPVSALIHAATMVAAGVFLVARVYPLMAAGGPAPGVSTALTVVAWVGVITAVFAACIAVAQTDIKRILAYSTVSQLGFMMLGLGVGGVAVGMFHLITHAFFKALLFMGAGSVIHGVHEEQDIRRMGGLRRFMPVTFLTYAVGMMALAGVPVFFAGFWSKDGILHAAHGWQVSPWPFWGGLFGALLTAFYMTRQVAYVFFGEYRGATRRASSATAPAVSDGHHEPHDGTPHESPAVMTGPLAILAFFAIGLGFIGTPAWPWFQSLLSWRPVDHLELGRLFEEGGAETMALSILVVAVGIGAGWWLYGRRPASSATELDVLERHQPAVFRVLREKFYVDEFYEATFIRLNDRWAWFCVTLDNWVWGGLVLVISYLVLGVSWLDRLFDEYVVNGGFDQGCRGIMRGGTSSSKLQDGNTQTYLRTIGVALTALLLLLTWGCHQ